MSIYKKHVALNRKFHVFGGYLNKIFITRRFLNSHTSENTSKNHKLKCEKQELTSTGTSGEPHLHWKEFFRENFLSFRVYAFFQADNEFDNSNIGNKTTIIYKQNPMCTG